MHRIDSETKSVDKFGVGKHGFTEGDLTAAPVVPATKTTDDWFDSVQEELATVVENAGEVLDKTNNAQVYSVLRAITGGLQPANWTIGSPAGAYTGACNSFAYAADIARWIFVGASGEIQTSDDQGFTWTQRTSDGPFAGTLLGVGYDGSGLFCIVGSTGEIQTSPDGITWTARTAAGAYAGTWQNVDHDQSGLWVAVGASGELQTSADGITWTQRTVPGGPGTLQGLRFANSLWVTADGSDLWTSPDAITWTLRSTINILAIDYSPELDRWVAVGGAANLVSSSEDGITWTARTPPTGVTVGITDVIYSSAAGAFVAVGGGAAEPNVLISFDGISWKAVEWESANAGVAIQTNGQVFMAGTGDTGANLMISLRMGA